MKKLLIAFLFPALCAAQIIKKDTSLHYWGMEFPIQCTDVVSKRIDTAIAISSVTMNVQSSWPIYKSLCYVDVNCTNGKPDWNTLVVKDTLGAIKQLIIDRRKSYDDYDKLINENAMLRREYKKLVKQHKEFCNKLLEIVEPKPKKK